MALVVEEWSRAPKGRWTQIMRSAGASPSLATRTLIRSLEVHIGESMEGGLHSRRLHDSLARVRGVDEETTDIRYWDAPGHDGVVTETDSDPDRAQLRSDIGQYASFASFPVDAQTLVSVAENKDAPEHVLAELRSLDPGERFVHATQLWTALGLGSNKRF